MSGRDCNRQAGSRAWLSAETSDSDPGANPVRDNVMDSGVQSILDSTRLVHDIGRTVSGMSQKPRNSEMANRRRFRWLSKTNKQSWKQDSGTRHAGQLNSSALAVTMFRRSSPFSEPSAVH